jgi:hypothetical protein
MAPRTSGRVTGVDAELHVELHGSSILAGAQLRQFHGLGRIVERGLVDHLAPFDIFYLLHFANSPLTSPTTTPMERAVPAIILIAASTLAALRSASEFGDFA